MAKAVAGNQQKEDSTVSLVLWPLRYFKHLALSFVILSLCALCLDVAAARKLWQPGVGPEQMQYLANYALDYQINVKMARWMGDATLWIWFKWYGLYDAYQNYSNGSGEDVTWVQKTLFRPFYNDLQVLFIGAYLFGCRLAGFISAIPLYFLVCGDAVVDGLVERQVRRACAGNESASMYHRAKFWSFRLIPPLAAFTWLCLPLAIHPLLVISPTVLFSAILIRTQMKYYKKYF